MGGKGSNDGGFLLHAQQQSPGSLQKLAVIGLLALLLSVNLLYQVKTHARMQQLTAGSSASGIHCSQDHQLPVGSSSSSKQVDSSIESQQQQDAASEAAERRGVDYLVNNVLTSRPQRRPVDNVILPTLKAKNKTVEQYRSKVSAYLSSSEFKQRWDALKAQTTNERGIVISAGGKYYLPQALVLLRILRHNLNCTLPVEIFWLDGSEMDDVTLKALKRDFAPLKGFDASKIPYPAHHLPGATLKGFPMKPWALLNSRFKEVLLLDCDVVPMRDPSYMFDAPEFRQAGNYFWGDIYDKAASKLAGRPVAVFKPQNKKPSRKQARSSATDVLSEAVHAAEADGAASASQAKPRKQPVKSTKKLAKKESKARRAAARAGVAAAGSGRLNVAELDDLAERRMSMLVKKTSDTYASHTRKWKWFLAHDDQGNLLEPPRVGDLTTIDGRGNATRFMGWLEEGCKGWKPSRGRKRAAGLSLQMVEGCHSALAAIYTQQAARYESEGGDKPALPATLLADFAYKTQYNTIKAKLCQKGQRDTTVDPQRNTIKDTYDLDDLERIVDTLMSKGTQETDRALAMAMWAHSSVGRSDDVRLFYLADLITPQYIPAVGPCNCYVLPLVLRGGKVQRGSRPGYSGVIRSRDPALCPVRALAYHFAHRFTLGGHIFPDPADSEAWLTAAMFPGRQDPTSNITYERQAQELRELFDELGLDFSKLTHIFRVGGARHLDAAGVDDSVILRMGKWLRQAMYTHYLSFFKTEGLLAMGDWPYAQQKDFGHYWSERFELHVVQYLTDLIFPFLADFSSSLEEMDVKPPSAKSMVDVLEYLAVVLVQDAVELLSEDKYTDHPVHKYLLTDDVFRSVVAAFKKLKAENAFEVRKPRTTKEVALHNNQLLQQLLTKLEQMAHSAIAAAEVAGWSQALFEQPQAPRMTPQEMEEAAAMQTAELLNKIQTLEDTEEGQAADPAALDDPELFAAASGGVAGAGVTTPSKRNQKRQRSQQAPKPVAAAAASAGDAGTSKSAGGAAASASQKLSDEEEVRVVRRARRSGTFTGRLAGLSSRAGPSLASSQSEELCDVDMQDASNNLTPRTLFPNLDRHKAGSSKSAARASNQQGGFSSKLVGVSSHVPNPATYLSKRHDVAATGATINLPGYPIPVPVAALQAAGFMPGLPAASNLQPQQPAAAPAVAAAAAAAGDVPTADLFGEGGAAAVEDSLCTAGRVSEASRHAVMAFGISAAAAGSGAVPNLHVGMHAAASSAAAAAVARGKGIKGSSKSMKLAEAAAQAAATATVAAVQKAEASAQRSALPPYADLQSVQQLWKLWKKGSHSSPAWEQHEEQGKAWRRGERQRWHELLQVLREVETVACNKGITPEQAAAIVDAERGACTMPEFIKRQLPRKLAARKALQQAAAPAADAQATAAAAAAASQAAAAAHQAAAAADAAAQQAAAAVASRLH